MTFTYTPSATPDDTTKIRYHIQDTDSTAAIFSDEEIAMVLALEGSVNASVISLIKAIISKLSHEPDVTADWLKIDWRRSVASWQTMLATKQQEFGLGARVSAGYQHAYRADSFQDEAPDWDEIFGDLADDTTCF